MTNWGYKAVRKVLQTFGGAELAQQQSGRITGEPGNPEVATLARRAGAESCVLLKNNNHTLPLDLSAPVALFGRVQKNYLCRQRQRRRCFRPVQYQPGARAGKRRCAAGQHRTGRL